MKHINYFFIVSLLVLGSCGSKEKGAQQIVEDQTQVNDSVIVKTISPRIKIKTDLPKEVKQFSEENTSLHDLNIQIQKFNSISVKDFSDEMITIQENCVEFLKTVPKEFTSKSVSSRIGAIQTFAKAIAFEQKKGLRDTTKIHAYSTALVESYNSLLFQLEDTKNILPENVKKSLKKTIEIKVDSLEVAPLF